jgi:redox-sensitive bicupin YhaK (pirin superfamily)
MHVAHLNPGVFVTHRFAKGRGGYFYLIEGKAELNSEAVATRDAAKVTGPGTIRVRALTTSELLIVDTPL